VPREPNPADAALAAKLRERGEEGAIERKLERTRQAGMLASERSGLGHARGSRSIRADDELEQAIEAFALLAEHGTYQKAFLAMFIDGKYVVSEEKVKEQLLSLVDGLDDWVRKRGGGRVSDALDLALGAANWAAGHAKSSPAFRELRGRLDEQYELLQKRGAIGYRFARERLADFFTEAVLLPLTGAPSSPEEGARVLEVAGVTTLLDDPYTGAANQDGGVSAALEQYPNFTLSRMRTLIRSSTMAQLEQGRDDTKILFAFARAYGAFLKGLKQDRIAYAWILAGNASITQIALTVPVMVVMREWRHDNLEEFLEMAVEWTPGFTAFAALLATLPDQLIEDLKREHPHPTEPTRHELRHYIEQFATTHPEEHKELIRPRQPQTETIEA
jgi:hypothetical protein